MKKVLSLVLAAAMVMGMSVSAFAADFSAPPTGTGAKICVNNDETKENCKDMAHGFAWGNAYLPGEEYEPAAMVGQGTEGEEYEYELDFDNLTEGDDIYFAIKSKTGSSLVEKEHKYSEDCVLFTVNFEGLDKNVQNVMNFIGWTGEVKVSHFLNAVEAMNNSDVKATVKAYLEAKDLGYLAEVLEYIINENTDETIKGAMAAFAVIAEVLDIDLCECEPEYDEIKGVEGLLNQKVPSNWVLKIENSEYIEDAELVRVTGDKADKLGLEDGVYAKVTLNDDFKAQDEEEAGNKLEFFMYIWDGKHASDYAEVHFAFAEYKEIPVYKADAKHIIPAEKDAYYVLKDANSLEVVFELDNSVYVTAKLWKGDKYMIKSAVDAEWSKDLSKEYDTDIEVLTIESDMDIREVLWESKKDDKQVVELVDGALVAVDSEYVTKYEVIDGIVLAKGYIAETEEGSYALIDADIELIVPEVEVEADKANPSTGASDFVGAAVAMAVVSVAAAGALALKK